MQRWKHAGRGPKTALALAAVFAVASLALFQSAYASTPPYPGPPGQPGIPNGPTLGCNPTGTTNETWVCGFDALSTVTFKVDGHFAGTYTADSNGCVLVVVTFLHGEVSVNGNAPVHVHPGLNYLIVEGTKTTKGVKLTVGLRLPFTTPREGTNSCSSSGPPPTAPTTSFPPPSSTSTFPGRPTIPTFPVVTTAHGYVPTTLAWVIKTPLQDSPNKVVLEASLIAAVLAAVLGAGALGAIWSSGEGAPGGEAPVAPVGAPTPGGDAPLSSEPPAPPGNGAFERPETPTGPQGGGAP